MSECVRVRACMCTYNPKAQPSPPSLTTRASCTPHGPKMIISFITRKTHTPGKENPRPPGADCEGGSMRSDAFSPSLPALPGFLALAECLLFLFLFLAERCLWCLGSGLSARVGRGRVLRGEVTGGNCCVLCSPVHTPVRRSFLLSVSLCLSPSHSSDDLRSSPPRTRRRSGRLWRGSPYFALAYERLRSACMQPASMQASPYWNEGSRLNPGTQLFPPQFRNEITATCRIDAPMLCKPYVQSPSISTSARGPALGYRHTPLACQTLPGPVDAGPRPEQGLPPHVTGLFSAGRAPKKKT